MLEAAANILYYEKARASTLSFVISFLKQGAIVDLEARPPIKEYLHQDLLVIGKSNLSSRRIPRPPH